MQRYHLLTLVSLVAFLLVQAGCYRKEIRRKSYPGFAVESNAEPTPTGKNYERLPLHKKRDPLAKLWRSLTRPFERRDKKSTAIETPKQEADRESENKALLEYP